MLRKETQRRWRSSRRSSIATDEEGDDSSSSEVEIEIPDGTRLVNIVTCRTVKCAQLTGSLMAKLEKIARCLVISLGTLRGSLWAFFWVCQ